MHHPRTYAIYGYLALFGATFGGAALVAALLGDSEGKVWWPLSRLGSAGMLEVAGVTDLRVRGIDRLDQVRPAVVMANHQSLFDPAVLMRPATRPFRFVAKKELRRVPIFGAALAAMGHVFVDRGAKDDRNAMREAARAIADGKTVLVFPEGTRSETGELLPFKSGGFRLAMDAGVPIVPIGIAGSHAILPKHGGFQRKGPVAVVVGEPIFASGSESLDGFVARVRGEIERLSREAAGLAAA